MRTGGSAPSGLGERGRRALRHKILLSCAVPTTAARSVTRCQDDAGCSERGFLTTPGIYGDPKSQETWHREPELPSGTSTKTHIKPGALLELSGLEHRALCRLYHTLFHPWNREQLNCPGWKPQPEVPQKARAPLGKGADLCSHPGGKGTELPWPAVQYTHKQACRALLGKAHLTQSLRSGNLKSWQYERRLIFYFCTYS